MRRRVSTRRGFWLWLAALLAVAVPSNVRALEFAIVGPRAMGMGGAGVAVTSDATATYWNPAGLAMSQTVDIRGQASAHGIDRGVLSAVKDINDLDKNNPANIGQAQALANKLNQPGVTISGIGSAGLYFKGYWGSSAFGVNVSDVGWGGQFLKTPISVTQTGVGGPIQVSGQYSLRGLEARQAAFSYAYAFADRTFAIGATLKVIQGAAYTGQINVNNADDLSNIKDAFGKANLSTKLGVDVGAVFRPAPWLRLGIVGKDLNQ